MNPPTVKLRDQARAFEQKEDWSRAIEAYVEILRHAESAEGDAELPLYNKVGDLYLRLGRQDEAVNYYVQAADRYAEAGLHNNAIALCNKALRYMPGRAELYRKLGQYSAAQGFFVDARKYFLDYAERRAKAGAMEEAFAALEEFAGLSDDPDIREMLARQLQAHGRTRDAVDQIKLAYASRLRAGQAEQAEALKAELAQLDASADVTELPARPPAAAAPEPPPAPVQDVQSGVLQFESVADQAGFGGEEEPAAAAPPPAPAIGRPAPAASEPEPLPLLDLGGDMALPDGTGGIGPGATAAAKAESAAPTGEEPLPLLDLAGGDLAGPAAPVPAPAAPQEEELPDVGLLDLDLGGGLDLGEPPPPTALVGGLETMEPVVLPPGEAVDTEAEELPLLELGGPETVAPEEPEEGEPEPLPLLEAAAPEESELGGLEVGDLDFGGAAPLAPPPAPAPTTLEFDEEAAAPDLTLAAGEPAWEDLGVAGPSGGDAEDVIAHARELVAAGEYGEAVDTLERLHGTLAHSERLNEAIDVVEELIRLEPDNIRFRQEKAEYAARLGDTEILVIAYVDLALSLARAGATTKARAIYQRVLDLAPDNAEAREVLYGDRDRAAQAAKRKTEYVDLTAFLDDEPVETTRFVVAEQTPTGDEARDFANMLSQFKTKVSEHVAVEDSASHYDLGLAFKEMGLIDEAIQEFQTALRGGEERLKVYEELGHCFMLNSQYHVAVKILSRALQLPHDDDMELLGVYYQLGRCHEELGQRAEARDAFERVVAIDMSFADASGRLAKL